MWWLMLVAQTALNFAAGWGAFEMDADQDGLADGWRFHPAQNFTASGVQVERILDSRMVYRGGASHALRISRRGAGPATQFFLLSPPIYPLSPAYPQPGDSLTVTFYIQDSGRVGLTYVVYLVIRRPQQDTSIKLYESPHFPQKGWQEVRKTVSLPSAFRSLEIALHVRTGEGPVGGNLWLDHLSVTAGKNLPPLTPRPFRLVRFMPSSFTTDWIRDLVTFDLFVVQDPLSAARIKEINPSLPVYLYATPWFSVLDRSTGPVNILGQHGDFFPFDWANQKRPECFLTTRTGERRFRERQGLEEYAMNLQDPVCRDRVFLNLTRFLEDAFRRNTAWAVNGILGEGLGWYATETPDGITTLKEVLRELQQSRKIPVIGALDATLLAKPGMEDLVRKLQRPVLQDFVHKDGVVPAPSVLEAEIKLAAEIPVAVQTSWPKDPNLARYVVDALYLVAHPEFYVSLSRWDERPAEYGLLDTLRRDYGEPRGRFQVYERKKDEGALLLREFSRGVLLFNTSGVHTFSYRLKKSMLHPEQGALAPKTEVPVPPHTSLFLRYAD